jgi:predicted phosphohydrolase
MTVWAIADLHLSFARAESRERFGGRWRDHAAKVEREWRSVVRDDDLVLLPGDVSMARTHRDVQPDLAWLDRLPGKKVISAGNHDAWWNGADRVRPMLRKSLLCVGGDAIAINGVVVCGSLGVPVPSDEPDPAQVADCQREIALLDRALADAERLRTAGKSLYVLWHYPPFDQHRRPGPCVARFEQARITACVYGHLHIEGQWSHAVQGEVHGIRYHFVAADAVGFRPLRVSGD